MAYYAALVSLVQLLEDIIDRNRYQNVLLDKQQIVSVYEKFGLLQALLDGYSPKYTEAADSLKRRIRDAAHQAQDTIEVHITGQMHQYLWEKNQMPQQLQELEEVKEEVSSIVEELRRIMESHTTKDNLQLKYYSTDVGTSDQASGTTTMVGIEERVTMIKDQLCGEPSKLRVVSIVGMGGIGKTTMARNIFDDGLIVHRFDCRTWVTISQDYDLKKVLEDILNSMIGTTNKSAGVGELEEKIYKHLKGRRYLIIMDDMWDTKVWDDMKRLFPDDSNGSRIVITTRISNVASYASKFGFYHQMQLLNVNQSWNLFREKVLFPLELEDIGRLIAKNCRGLPLAIVLIAGLLAKVDQTRSDWEEIARNVSSTVAENDEHFSKILYLSYYHLPHHLKPCLLFIGGFPEDYEIRVSKLVKLWVAEGFLKPDESKSLEAMAEEYLEDLINRNLILITKKRPNGKIKCCGIHDLLRGLCINIINREDFLHVMHPNSNFHPTDAQNVRRLFIHGYLRNLSQMREVEKSVSHVRSIICHTFNWRRLFFGSNLLRVLDATEGIFRCDIPREIWGLFHLRYLAFAGYLIFNIPSSISLLQNLQTIIINSDAPNRVSLSLPSQIWEMPNLRHIMSSKNLHLRCQFFNERTVGEPSILENLQTLSWIDNVSFTNEVIKMIPNLEKLKVFCCENDAMWKKFCLANLSHLRQLESLNIYCLNSPMCKVNPLPESFPLTLKKLSLRSSKIPWKDMSVVGSLPNLQELKLLDNAFVGEKWEPVEGEFLQLKFLLMDGLELMYWQVENTHFPTLQQLKIMFCETLQEIPLEIGDISTLELVEVVYSELAAESARKMLEEQRDLGNYAFQVHVSPQNSNFSEDKGPKNKQKIKEVLQQVRRRYKKPFELIQELDYINH